MATDFITYGVPAGAAGPRVEIRTGSPAGPAPTQGSVALVGAFPWGPVGKAILHGNRGGFVEWSGPYTFEEEAARAAEDAYEIAGNEINLACVRVTDGAERTAKVPLHNRIADPSVTLRTPPTLKPTVVSTLKGAYPGERGGASFLVVGRVSNVVTAISGATFDTAQASVWLVNRFKDATFGIVGDTQTWKVSASSAAGVLTMTKAISTTLTGARNWYVYVPARRFPELDGFDLPHHVGAVVRMSKAKPTTAWDLDILRDGDRVRTVERCEWTGDRDPAALLDELITTRAQAFLAMDNTFAATGLSNIERNLPANWAGIAQENGIGSTTLNTAKVQWWWWERTSADAKGPFVASVVGANGILPCKIVCTFTAATAFSVAITDQNGETVAYALAAGATGTEYDLGVAYLPKFTINAGETAAFAGETVTIHCRPLPFAGAVSAGTTVFPFAFAETGTGGKDSTLSYVIVSGTFESITVAKSIDLSSKVVVPTAPKVEAATAGPYDLTLAKTFKWYDGDGTGTSPSAERTITTTVAAAGQTAAQVAAHLTTLLAASYGAHPVEVEFYVTAVSKVGVRSLRNVGSRGKLKVTDGTINAVVGFTNNTTGTGTDGTVLRLEHAQSCTGGFDGLHGVVGSTIVSALAVPTSGLNDLDDVDLGLVHLGTPGYYSSDVVTALEVYAASRGYTTVAEADRAYYLVGDAQAAANARRASVIESRVLHHVFPGYFKRAYPPYKPNATVTNSALGPYLGRKAKAANQNRGYHKVPAGSPGGSLVSVVKRLPGSDAGGFRPDDAVLTRAGIVPIVHAPPDVFIFGDEGLDIGGGTYWIHKMETILHTGRLLYGAAKRFAYREIPPVWKEVELYIRNRLMPLFRAGAFSGATFDEAVIIQVGPVNNPSSVQNAGNVIADVQLVGLINAAKNVTFRLASDSVAVAFG